MSTEVMEKRRLEEDKGRESEEDTATSETSRPAKRKRLSSDCGGSGSDGGGGCEEAAVVVREAGKGRINPPRSNLFRNLPPEIFLRILSQLTPHELVQSASCCREWYHIASDAHLWRILDLSQLNGARFNPAFATTLRQRLSLCRSFTLQKPPHLTSSHVTALLHFLSTSAQLEQLALRDCPLNSHGLEQHFRISRTNCLTNVDLSHSPVTTAAIVALMDRHRATLRSLDLSHTSIGDGTLRAVSSAQVLQSLDISSCTAISRTSIRNFLCKRFPACLETLSLRALKEVKISWLYETLKSARLKVLDVTGCERLSLGDLKELQESTGGRVEVRHDAREAGGDSVWGYRRYIEYLGTDPSLEERLREEKEKGDPSKPSSSA